ncbi:hypothetical protein CT0861_04331 [Colletotrichum tofieldiae]|uniref:Uncharacterized protein n=1 Tax=Colletotrichum tofieldiae TaxID=708197 RepID=A0A166VY27_9PEZI|nr:hypothetical protein CT0861_04331 [Colletotrichum tofieldiae]
MQIILPKKFGEAHVQKFSTYRDIELDGYIRPSSDGQHQVLSLHLQIIQSLLSRHAFPMIKSHRVFANHKPDAAQTSHPPPDFHQRRGGELLLREMQQQRSLLLLLISSKNTCPKFNDPAGYQPCATVSPPANSANSNFVFYGNGNLAGGWTWESDTTKGVVVTSNGLITWQRNNINTVCIRQKNNKGTTCYRRPAYAACLLNPGDIDNAWGFP